MAINNIKTFLVVHARNALALTVLAFAASFETT
jgi:hypothetical protein